jgi:hypothetical protein
MEEPVKQMIGDKNEIIVLNTVKLMWITDELTYNLGAKIKY